MCSSRVTLLACVALLAPAIASAQTTTSDEIAALRAEVAALRQLVTEMQSVARVRPDRLEILGGTDALLGLYAADRYGEAAMFGVNTDASGRLGKTGSISWKWSDPNPLWGYNVARLNATYVDYYAPPAPSGLKPWRDDVALRVFGGQGVCLFCTDDTWRSAPGRGVLAVRGVIRWQQSDTPATAHVPRWPSNPGGPVDFLRQLDEAGVPFWLPIYR